MTTNDHTTPTGGKADTISQQTMLFRVTEAAELLGISRTNVYYLMNEGRLASVRIGSRRLIPRAALESFVAALPAAS